MNRSMLGYYDPKTYPQRWNFLEPGTIVDQYIIERELAHGGFSSVYLARHISNQSRVAIKEYLPRKLAHRTWNNIIVPNSEKTHGLYLKGRSHFFKEAETLAKLKHRHIVDVINFFHANDTVYMVMNYELGMTLDKAIKTKKTKISEKQLNKIFDRLLSGVKVMHKKNILHLDIKPSNILIRPHNSPMLLDFGAIQKYNPTPKNHSPSIITHGFSPLELYSNNAHLGPWTDIYAVGATMYYCLSRRRPVHSSKRVTKDTLVPANKAFKKKYPQHLLHAIDWAMKIDPAKRPQSIEALQYALSSNKYLSLEAV